jgi:putative methionine-R-sulfoxide reductase with GAF domain
MKNLYRPLSILFIVLFTIGIFFLIYYVFFAFPAELKDTLGIKNAVEAEKITAISIKMLLLVGVELAIGLLVFILLSMQNRDSNEQLVYVEKFVQKQEKGTDILIGEQNTYSEKAKLLGLHISQLNRPLKDKMKSLLEGLCKELEASVGVAFMSVKIEDRRYLEFTAGYAYHLPDSQLLRFEFGEGLAGQVAKSCRAISIQEVPQDYISIVSGLGKASPKSMIILPIIVGESVVGVIEIASFKPLGDVELSFAKEVVSSIN